MTAATPDELSIPALGFTGCVKINGVPVPLYSVKVLEDQRKTTCFIEAKLGEAFTVHATHEAGKMETDLAADVYVDGTWRAGTVLERGSKTLVHPFTGAKTSATTERPFIFSQPKTTDDADLACGDERIVKNMGTIQLRFLRVREPTLVVNEFKAPAEEQTLHEKAKKALVSHSTALGEETAVPGEGTPMGMQCEEIDPPDAPYYTLEFRYQSRDLLEIDGHVEEKPKSDVPVAGPSGAKRKVETIMIDSDSDDGDEAEERKRKAKVAKLERKAQDKAVKREAGGEVLELE